MKTTITDAGPCRKRLEIEVPAEDVDREYKDLVKAYAAQVKVPGFRPGRVPQEIVERRFKKEIAAELRDRLVPRAYHQALEQEKLDPVAIADMDAAPEAAHGQPLKFSIVIDIPPSFELPPYKGIALKAGDTAVADEAVQKMLDDLRKQSADYKEVTGRPAQVQDLAQVEFTGTIDGKPVDEAVPAAKGLGHAKGLWLAVDEDSFPPAVGQALVGASIGDTREVDSTFPATTTVKALAGRTVHYRVTLTGLRQPVLPEVDEAFCKRFGAANADEVRAKIRAELESAARQRDLARQRDEIARHLIAGTTMDLPATLVQRETEQIVYDIVRTNAQRGIGQDAIVGQKQRIFETANRSAAESVKLRYILHRIAETEKIAATDADLDGRIEAMAARYQTSPAELRASLKKRDGLDNLREQVRTDKVLDFLVENAKVG